MWDFVMDKSGAGAIIIKRFGNETASLYLLCDNVFVVTSLKGKQTQIALLTVM
jgi:hypothetical protein